MVVVLRMSMHSLLSALPQRSHNWVRQEEKKKKKHSFSFLQCRGVLIWKKNKRLASKLWWTKYCFWAPPIRIVQE